MITDVKWWFPSPIPNKSLHVTTWLQNQRSFPLGDVILTGLPRPEHVSAAMGLEGESINPDGTLTAFTWRP